MKRRPKGTGSVYQRPDGMWVGTLEAGWTTRGTRRRIVVYAKTQLACKQKLKERERRIAREGLPAEGALGRAPTVKAYAEQWLKMREHQVRPHTYQSDASQLAHWIIPEVGHVRLDQMSATHVRKMHRSILNSGRKESTAIRVHAVLKMLLAEAEREGYTIPRGAFTVASPRKNEPDRSSIPLDDAAEILRAASLLPDRSRWFFAFTQAARPAEALGLTWDCVDLKAGTVDLSWQLMPLAYRRSRDRESGFRIPDGYEVRQLVGRLHLARPKTAAGRRIIPLIPGMRDELEAWKEKCPESLWGLVWPTVDGLPRDDKDDRKQWYEIIDSAQVASVDKWYRDGRSVSIQGRRYQLYEARHTTATMLQANGVSDTVIKAIMGHASILSSEAYMHVSLDVARRQLEDSVSLLLPSS